MGDKIKMLEIFKVIAAFVIGNITGAIGLLLILIVAAQFM